MPPAAGFVRAGYCIAEVAVTSKVTMETAGLDDKQAPPPALAALVHPPKRERQIRSPPRARLGRGLVVRGRVFPLAPVAP